MVLKSANKTQLLVAKEAAQKWQKKEILLAYKENAYTALLL